MSLSDPHHNGQSDDGITLSEKMNLVARANMHPLAMLRYDQRRADKTTRTVPAPTLKAVLFVLANHTDRHGSARPGHQRLAADACAARRSVQVALEILAEHQIITWRRRDAVHGSRRGSGQTNEYTVHFDRLADLTDDRPCAHGAHDHDDTERTACARSTPDRAHSGHDRAHTGPRPSAQRAHKPTPENQKGNRAADRRRRPGGPPATAAGGTGGLPPDSPPDPPSSPRKGGGDPAAAAIDRREQLRPPAVLPPGLSGNARLAYRAWCAWETAGQHGHISTYARTLDASSTRERIRAGIAEIRQAMQGVTV